jgi:hypothetical protein
MHSIPSLPNHAFELKSIRTILEEQLACAQRSIFVWSYIGHIRAYCSGVTELTDILYSIVNYLIQFMRQSEGHSKEVIRRVWSV